jgi:hypothetical protein
MGLIWNSFWEKTRFIVCFGAGTLKKLPNFELVDFYGGFLTGCFDFYF